MVSIMCASRRRLFKKLSLAKLLGAAWADVKPGSEDRALSILKRHNVKISGCGERSMMFAHGFGCDQNMWRFVAPAFEDDFKVVLFDHVGAGGSGLSGYGK